MITKQPEISRAKPTCFLFVIDLSGSMDETFGAQPGIKKADGVADVTNRTLDELLMRSTNGETIFDRYHIGVIGYGGRGVGPALGGALSGRKLVTLSELATHPLEVEERDRQEPNGTGGLVTRKVTFPVWVRPQASGSTPMVEALTLAAQVVKEFLANHPDCYPPTVLHVTDGESTDGDPEPKAAELRDLRSTHGNVLLFNAHVSKLPARPVEFPDEEGVLPDTFARLLFRMSSVIPEWLHSKAQEFGFRVGPATRGFVFNGDLVSVTRFIDIGTTTQDR